MDSSKTARTFLGLNAGFSLLMGLGALIAPGSAAGLIFEARAAWQDSVLRLLGVGLLLFGLALTWMARDRFLTRGQVRFISVMDIGWVLGSALLLIAAGEVFSLSGRAAVVTVAMIVALFALGQLIGAGRMVPPPSMASVTTEGGYIRAEVSRPVDAPAEVVWRVMTDHPGYADVADNLSKVEVVAGEGLGMQRRCYGPKGENWLETCELYDDGQAFGFRVHTEADDYPYPMTDLHGAWSVEGAGNGSRFTISITAKPTGNALARTVFVAVAKRRFKAVLADLADAWAARMEHEAKV